MRYRITKDKKGVAIDEAIPLIVFIFATAFILIFLNYQKDNREDKKIDDIEKQMIILDAQQNLMLFSRSVHNGSALSEIAIKSYHKKEFSSLDKIIKGFFDEKYDGWIFVIEDSNGNKILSSDSNNFIVDAMISLGSTPIEELAYLYLPIVYPENRDGGDSYYLKLRLLRIARKEGTATI